MAIKDWKKVKVLKDSEINEIYRWMNDTDTILIEKERKGYIVVHEHEYGAKKLKIFKTKLQALKFAKAYMRKH